MSLQNQATVAIGRESASQPVSHSASQPADCGRSARLGLRGACSSGARPTRLGEARTREPELQATSSTRRVRAANSPDALCASTLVARCSLLVTRCSSVGSNSQNNASQHNTERRASLLFASLLFCSPRIRLNQIESNPIGSNRAQMEL